MGKEVPNVNNPSFQGILAGFGTLHMLQVAGLSSGPSLKPLLIDVYLIVVNQFQHGQEIDIKWIVCGKVVVYVHETYL